MSVHEKHMQVVSSCKVQEEIYVDQEAVPATMNKSRLQIEAEKLGQDIQTLGTVLVWIDGVWSGDSVSYKQLFAGTGRLQNHAFDTPRVSRWETSDSRWEQDRDIDENSRTCRLSVNEAARYVKDTINQVIPVTADVPDAADSLNIEFERVKLTQEAAIARDEGRLAEEAEGRELPERPLLERMALECAKENLSELGTKVPENEPKSDPVNRLGIVVVIRRFAVLWTTRAKWDCLDDTCKLTRTDNASDEAIVSGYCFKRWNSESDWSGESDWNGGSDWISRCIRDKCWSRMSSRGNDAGLACVHEQIQRAWSRLTRSGAEVQSNTRDQKNEKSVRQVDWRMLSAHRWVGQSTSRSRSTPYPHLQVTDRSLFDEHERCGMR